MTFEAGTELDHDRLVEKLGEGGMGVVWKARDTSLDRDVAVKVLSERLASDEAFLARFEREAKAVAALSHPNIVGIFGFGRAAGRAYAVMELLEGQTLRDLLAHGPLPPRKAIDIARQVANGLAAAHGKGIVHRDLKPENVFVTSDGRARILDFGLATALPGAGPEGETALPTRHLTRPGTVMGTIGYMSPEQVRAEPADSRSDIFSLGTLLWEMLSGAGPFARPTPPETMTAILREDPPEFAPGNRPPPPALDRILRRCLQKSPDERFQNARDLAFALEGATSDSSAISAAGPEGGDGAAPGRRSRLQLPSSGPRRPWRVALPWVLVAGLATALLLATLRSPDEIATAPLRRFTLEIPSESAPNWTDFTAAISPDGSRIAYNCREGNRVDICIRLLESLAVEPIVEARDVDEIFFSPDSEWLGTWDGIRVAKVPVAGGLPETIFENGVDEDGRLLDPSDFHWGDDDSLYFESRGRLYQASVPSGAVEPLALGGETERLSSPWSLPAGDRVLLTRVKGAGLPHGAIADLEAGTIRELPLLGTSFRYVRPGFLVYRQERSLFAVAFDLESERLLGEPQPVLSDVWRSPRIADDGTMVYIPVRGKSDARLVWVDREGRAIPVEGERRDYSHLDLSPDGNSALLDINPDIYVRDLLRGTRRRLVEGWFPVWTADSKRASYSAGNLEWIPADGSGTPEVLIETDEGVVPTSWNSVTGDLAYFSHRSFQIWIRPPAGQPYLFLQGKGRLRSGRFSPNGRWIAFVDDETGEYQVYVTAYPGPGPKIPVSLDGGLSPIWASDGSELFYRVGGKVFAVEVRTGDGIDFGPPVELFDGPYTLDLMGHQRYDVARDGKSFLMVENSDDFPIVVVQNWPRELGELAGAAESARRQ